VPERKADYALANPPFATLNAVSVLPPIMEIVAPNGSITGMAGAPTIGFAANTAQIDFLAGQNIVTAADSMTGSNFTSSALAYTAAGTILNFGNDGVAATGPTNLAPFDDPRAVHIYAVAGDIIQARFSTIKRTRVRAGRDITGPVLYLQNADRDPNSADVSSVQAGRDLTGVVVTTKAGFEIRLGGPGYLEVQAGRDIFATTQGTTVTNSGIATVGNADNILLPRTGATIGVSAGVGAAGPHNAAFIGAYIDPATARSVADACTTDLVEYMYRAENADPTAAMKAYRAMSPEQQAAVASTALNHFRKLSPVEQAPLIQQVYFAEIRAGGEAVANGSGSNSRGYDRGYAAIQTLFPGSIVGGETTAYHGSISLYGFNRIRTEAGGDLNLLVPGGDIILGFENQVPNLAGQKDTARPGLLTLRGGGINTFTDGDVIVAQLRVFTELGGDIVMWSTNGDLNAGKGKKTSLVTSPPQFTLDPFAHVTKAPSTPQTGAGIAALQGVPGIEQGDVDLFAPHGTIDASDASIRASTVTIAAQRGLNADNIFAARTVGVPTIPPPPVTALTAADNTAGAVSRMTDMSKSNDGNQDKASLIIVEVLGYGGCSGSGGNSEECAKQ
jgi:filamentous hemagglutinin